MQKNIHKGLPNDNQSNGLFCTWQTIYQILKKKKHEQKLVLVIKNSFLSHFMYYGWLSILYCLKGANFFAVVSANNNASGVEHDGVWTERKRTTAAANKWSAGGDACHFRYVTKGFGTFCAMQFTPSHLSAHEFTVAAAYSVMCMRGGVLRVEASRANSKHTPL